MKDGFKRSLMRLGLLTGLAAAWPFAHVAPGVPTIAPATQPVAPSATTQSSFAVAGDPTHLQNAHYVTDKVISGAQPDDEESFKVLRDLGVKTIISVDGAAPDVETAKKYGMRYVHLPIGYDGVPTEQGLAIAKALEELPGTIYVHCHHGKHRSAAAVAVACVNNGMLSPARAESVLQTFGTGLDYKGLWKSARDARPADPETLKDLKVDYVETAKINDLAALMVGVDEHWDRIKLIQKSGWATPPQHPDLDAPHEVLQLQEHFREAKRLPSHGARPAAYQGWMKDAETGLEALQGALKLDPPDTRAASIAFDRVAASCTSCHAAYRN